MTSSNAENEKLDEGPKYSRPLTVVVPLRLRSVQEGPQLLPQAADPVVSNPSPMTPADAATEANDKGRTAAETLSQLFMFLFPHALRGCTTSAPNRRTRAQSTFCRKLDGASNVPT